MLNLNSPTVQSMLKDLPEGIGNLPFYMGSPPTVTTETIPIQQNNTEQFQNNIQPPFPSPKEMLAMQGQSAIYQQPYIQQPQYYPQQPQYQQPYAQQQMYYPTQFSGTMYQQPYTPQPYYTQQYSGNSNFVGGYNPTVQKVFEGYSNPYMGYGTYGGYNNMYGYQEPMDDDARERLQAAINNGISYDEQLINESELYKSLSRVVSKGLGRSKEEALKCENTFSIYDKRVNEEPPVVFKEKPTFNVVLKKGDDIVNVNKSSSSGFYTFKPEYFQRLRYNSEVRKINLQNAFNRLYQEAPERKLDNMDLFDFFNKGSGIIMEDYWNRKLMEQRASGTADLYNKEAFANLLENNGIKTKKKLNAVDRFVGRYGVMPDGRPVSPGRDPSIAESFSYDPKTGTYHVTAPNFFKDRIERARNSFISTLDRGD